MKKLIAVLAIFTMITAACGDDGEVTAEEADAVLDQIEGEPDTEPEVVEPEPEVVEPEPEVVEPEPEVVEPVLVATDSCVVFHHYSLDIFDEPYFTTVFVDIDLSEDDVVEATMPDGSKFDLQTWPSSDDATGLISVRFPVAGPGAVVTMPEISLNGEALHPQLKTDFWDNEDSFIAAASEVRDEEKFPKAGCTLAYMVQVDPPSVAFG